MLPVFFNLIVLIFLYIRQHLEGLFGRHFLNIFKLSFECSGFSCRRIYGIACFLEFFLGFIENITKLAEFCFNLPQNRPYFACPFFYGQGPEPHLETV